MKTLIFIFSILVLASTIYSAENAIAKGSMLVGGMVSYSSENTTEATQSTVGTSLRTGFFVADRVAVGPEILYINTQTNGRSASLLQAGVFFDCFVGDEDGDIFGRAGLGSNIISYDHRGYGVVFNPRIGLECLFSKRAAFDIEIGYMKTHYYSEVYPIDSDKIYLSVGLLGFYY